MESPVMTSASSHRLRSAVSACAQPTHSYLNSSYLSSSIKVESHNSGGCLKKFYDSGKNGESSLQDVTKKPHSSNDYSPLHKRYKTCTRNGFDHLCRPKRDGGEVQGSSNGGVLDLIPKRFAIGNHFLSRLNLHGHFLDSTTCPEYRHELTRNESVTDSCEKVIHDKSPHEHHKKTASDPIRDGSNPLSNRRHASGQLTTQKDTADEPTPLADHCAATRSDLADTNQTHHLSTWNPRHLVIRRTPGILREAINAWRSREGTRKPVPAVEDSEAFARAGEVSTMLECAPKCSGNPPSVTCPEFCGIVNDLRKSRRVCEARRTSPPSGGLDGNEEKRSKGMSKYEVFLGGSCNPTTWRTDFAIPELERMGISYYNPQQVEEWGPELMEVEYHAKENATVMFFVLDNQTRGVSALIEVAHLAGNRRNLILVVQPYTQNRIICEEKISKEECEDLKTGQEVLRDLVERQGIPVFDDIKVALNCTEKILRENLTARDLKATVRVERENPKGPRDVFEKPDAESSGEASAADGGLALKMLTGSVIGKAGKDLNGSVLDGVKFELETFSALMSDMKRQLGEGAVSSLASVPGPCCRDVYLGGTIENTSWRESIAVPILEEQKLSFFVPLAREGRERFTEAEAAAIENSFILLFAITSTARSVEAMAIAGHYIGRGANVVLSVEHLPPNATVGEEKLSENAVKDYNRGRMYLMDIAERSGVPVFTDISTAVKFVTEKCMNR